MSAARREAGFHAFRVESLAGDPVDLARYKGSVVLVVNVASACGYTPQYAGLEQLHRTLAPRGFAVLGFPCNQFGRQEPGEPEAIASFCESRFGVTFPMFAKCSVKPGAGQSPVYAYLASAVGDVPTWNFGKYLVGRDGRPIGFFESSVEPEDPELARAIDAALGPETAKSA